MKNAPHTAIAFLRRLRQRLHGLILQETDDSPPLNLLSPDGIKCVFDGMKHFALVAAVAFAGSALAGYASTVHPATAAAVPAALGYALIGLAATLGVLNMIFVFDIVERSLLRRARRHPLLWAGATVALTLGFSILLIVAAIVARAH